MQSSVMGSLMELSEKHEEIMYLTADSGEGGLDLMYRRNFPNRSFNFGIAEENMVSAACGMALCGKVPFVYTAAPFLAYRSYEFIRDDVCLQNVPVKLIGTGSGISVSSLGPTHHTTEDIAVLRSLPNLTILSPATPKQAYEAIAKAYEIKGPVYIRLAMNKEEEFFPEDYRLTDDGIDVLREGKDMAFVTTGAILPEVMKAANLLSESGCEAAVYSVFSLKPFSAKSLFQKCSCTPHLVSVEEHNIIGGLGSMLADEILQNHTEVSLTKIGLYDSFTKGYGTLDVIHRQNGLDGESIANKVKEVLL